MMRVLFTWLLVASSVAAQVQPASEAQINAAMTAGRAAIAAKDHARALTSFQAALTLADAKPLSKERRGALQQEALKHIADCHAELGQLDAAETALWRRKEVLSAWRGPLESKIGDTYLDLAYIQIRREQWPRAERYARDGLALYDAAIAESREAAPPASKSQAAKSIADDLARSRVAGLYTLGLALALQRRTDDAFKTWEEGYLLGDRFTPKPPVMMQIAMQAIELHDMSKRAAGRRAWVERLRALRARSP